MRDKGSPGGEKRVCVDTLSSATFERTGSFLCCDSFVLENGEKALSQPGAVLRSWLLEWGYYAVECITHTLAGVFS